MHDKQIENRLISEVTNFLRTKYSISLTIPPLKNLISMKINLKYLEIKSHQNKLYYNGIQNDPNKRKIHRYNTIIQQAQNLLNGNKFDISNIDNFMAIFLQTVDHDITVIQQNQNKRLSLHKVKEKLTYRSEEVNKKKDILNQSALKIHDKEDILSFIALDLKNFLNIVKLISDDYQSIKNVQVLTPLKIDQIFDKDITNEEDYLDHYDPLLEVLVRLKANIINLYKEVQDAEKANMPLKSVNLLANCKNFLLELSQFLITPNCTFNRLIFHIVAGQNENMSLIYQFYQQNLVFVKDLVHSVYKSVYVGHLFSDKYKQAEIKLQKFAASIIEVFIQLKSNDVISPEEFKQAEKQLQLHKQPIKNVRKQIRFIKKTLCLGKTKFMKQYTHEKICKKINILLHTKESLLILEELLEDSSKYMELLKKLTAEIKALPGVEENLSKKIEKLQKDETLQDHLKDIQMKSGSYSVQEQIFYQNYRVLQQKMITISEIRQNYENAKFESKHQKLSDFFQQKINQTNQVSQRYLNLQTKLLNSFQHLLEKKTLKEEQSITSISRNLKAAYQYLSTQKQSEIRDGNDKKYVLKSTVGFDIVNEDDSSEVVKDMLAVLNDSQYMLHHYVRSGNTGSEKPQFKKEEKLSQIKQYKICMEWLLTIFEGSMDEKVLESMIDRLDFKETIKQSINKNISKVNDLLVELKKYSKNLNKIINQIQHRKPQQNQNIFNLKKIISKVYRISKDRLILNQLIYNIYDEALSVYCQFMINNPSDTNLQHKGIVLFDKWTYQYALDCYQCLNRINILHKQVEDVSMLPIKTKNYIDDQIYEPYSNRLNTYVGYKESQLLNLVINLEKGLNINVNLKKNCQQLMLAIEKSNKKPSDQNSNKIKQCAEKVLKLFENITQIKDLSRESFVIHNIGELKQIEENYQQYRNLANDHS